MNGGDGTARINSVMDDDLLRRLRHVLVDEKIGLSEWIRRQAVAYVAEKEPKGKRRKGKEEGHGCKDGLRENDVTPVRDEMSESGKIYCDNFVISMNGKGGREPPPHLHRRFHLYVPLVVTVIFHPGFLGD